MASDSQDSSPKPIEVEKIASASCTQSGTFALLVSVVLFLLCVSWQNRKLDQALASYASARWNLAMNLEELRKDTIWQKYLAEHSDGEDKPLAQLINATVWIVDSQAETRSMTANRRAEKAETKSMTANKNVEKQSPPVPLPPGLASVVVKSQLQPPELSSIVQSWQLLNDSDVLARSRETSNYFNYSIVKWVNRRNNILSSNIIAGVCKLSEEAWVPTKALKSATYVPRISDQALMNCVRIRDLPELAQYELPQISNPFPLGNRIGRDVDLSPGSFPRDPYAASLVAEALLFFVLVYFSAFAREAVSVETFPTKGTLFGAFSRTRWMLTVFLLAIWTPFLACCAVAFTSRKPFLGLGVVPVVLATISVQRSLARKSFFKLVNPSYFFVAQYRRVRKLVRRYRS